MAKFRAPKENFSPYFAFKIVRKLFVVPDRCLPTFATLESTQAHHPLKLAHIQSRIDIPRTIATRNTLDIQNIDKIDLTTFRVKLLAIL